MTGREQHANDNTNSNSSDAGNNASAHGQLEYSKDRHSGPDTRRQPDTVDVSTERAENTPGRQHPGQSVV